MRKYVIGFAIFTGVFGGEQFALADGPGDGAPRGKATGVIGSVEAQKNEKVPFYGFSFDFTVADSSGLNAVGENYRNDLNFYFEPTWNVGARFLHHTAFKTLQIAGRFAVTQNLSGTDEANFGSQSNQGPEGTCGNPSISTQGGVLNPGTVSYCHPVSNNRRADYSDVWLTIRAPKIYTIPKLELNLNPSLRFIFPSSLESRFQTLLFAFSASISANRTFWKDRIGIGAGFGVSKNFHSKSTPQYSSGDNSATGAPNGGNYYDGDIGTGISNFYADPTRVSVVGGYNVNYSLLGTFTGVVKFNDKWSFDVLYYLIGAFPYGHSCSATVGGVTTDTCANGDAVAANSGATVFRPGNHDTQVFWATLAYQPLDYLGIALAWINWAPLQNKDSSYRQGIISTNYDAYTTVQLGITLSTDKLISKFYKN